MTSMGILWICLVWRRVKRGEARDGHRRIQPADRHPVGTDLRGPRYGGPRTRRGGRTSPLWQSSIALFRYVPPDEYQVYPGRRILFYKLTCTITNYQPRDQQVLGTIDLYGLPMDVKPLVKNRGTRPTLASASRAVKRPPV